MGSGFVGCLSTKPTFFKIRQGLALGYRRNKAAGAWVARVADGTGGNRTITIGPADDLAPADGKRVLSFSQAQDKAIALSRTEARRQQDPADLDRAGTVKRALEAYEADLKVRGGDSQNAARAVLHMSEKLLGRKVASLTSAELRTWRDGLARKLSPASVNRTCTGLKAALNLVADHDEKIANRRAWEMGLATIPDADQSNNVILDDAAVRAIIAASYGQSAEFGLLIEVAAVTGSRVSQLAALEIGDLQDGRADPRLMVPSSRKGRGKKAGRRPVPIGADLARRLRDLSAGKQDNEPLLRKPSGERWAKSDQSRPFRRAAKATKQDPETVSMYSLRHSSIVRQLLAGVPIRVIAVNHDTSVGMIERTYSKHIGDHSDALSRGALLDITPPPAPSAPEPAAEAEPAAIAAPAGNVVQLRRRPRS